MSIINEDFTEKNKLQDVGRWYITNYVKEISIRISSGSSILDAGAGESVYKKFFNHCDYKAIDLAVGESRWNYENLDYIGPLDDMPIDSETFDAVLCTQVLEHLEWPRESVQEMHRVLKPGGVLYLTVPMAQNEHQAPYDFFRYTSYGLKSLLEKAGFTEIKIKPFGGLMVRWAYELPRIFSIFPSAGLGRRNVEKFGRILLPIKGLLFVVIKILQIIFLWADRFDKEKNDPFGWSCEGLKSK